MTVENDRIKYDAEIHAAKKAGMINKDIAFALDVHKWVVDDACKRMNLVKRSDLHETPIRYNKKPPVEKTCPMCRKKHMSDPVIWTCAECKEMQERENVDGSGVWF